MATIVTFAELRDGKLRRPSLETVSEGRRLAGALGASVTSVVVGPGASGSASALASYGADRVYTFEDASTYATETYAKALARVIADTKPSVVLVPATAMGKDMAPRVAARVGAGLVSDCVALNVKDGRLQARRPVYAGKAYATVVWVGAPDSGRRAEVVTGALEGSPRARVIATHVTAAGKVELSEAQVIVSGGRGLRGPENFPLVTALGEAFGAAVGASRAVVDAGWVEHQMQVGQTGKTVSPTLYIACGISGAIQHLAGMSSSKYIVAINKDPDAPIFKVANYGIVGDVFQVLPRLTAAAKAYFAAKG
jgi:electron transfer flavoprotein alpha subunit